MRELFKWIDRIAAIITVATFAFTLLHFFGAVPVPHFDLSSGRKAFVALVIYEAVMAIAVSGASALLYRGTRIVFLSMLFPVIAWSFVNVDVMKTLFGETVWAPASKGWWVFRTGAGGKNVAGLLAQRARLRDLPGALHPLLCAPRRL